MIKKLRSRRNPLQLGVQKHKISGNKRYINDGFQLLEWLFPQAYLRSVFIKVFAENSFHFYTTVACKLCLVPFSLSNDGKLETVSLKKLCIHYSILVVQLISMMHKGFVLISRVLSGRIDTMTFICAATFLCYLVPFSTSSSGLILQGETIDLINSWPSILMYFSEENGRLMPLVANTKTAVVVSSVAILAMVIAAGVSGFSIVIQAQPFTFFAIAETFGLIRCDLKIHSTVWKILFWPMEFIMYLLPMFTAGWGTMVMLLNIMVIMNCANKLRYDPYS